jgi:gentisate 1,2-dioxygenase
VLDDETHVAFALERGQLVAEQTTVRRVLVFDERGAEYARAGVAYSSAFQEVGLGALSPRARRRHHRHARASQGWWTCWPRPAPRCTTISAR